MRTLKFRCFDNKSNKMIENCSHVQREGIEIMQFTGLLDRHGVVIYEGDILKLTDTTIPRTVEFHTGCFVVANRQGEAVSYRELGEQLLPEVIGDIYRNPELLKEDI